ncbi:MAG TPA: glycosyltransferase family 39 protein, partial [Saprospiraceae bacterium]|nr:glycosyltransferase family 39 protein [Saprospiraceae bacterium]
MAKKQHKEKFENKVASSTIEKTAIKSFFSWKDWALIGVICFSAYLIFSNVKNYQFVNWDDDRNFYENPLITSLNAENFWQNTVKIFKSDVIGNYNPLTIWTFALEKRLYGKGSYNGLESPGQWHHTNVLLHLICVWLVYLISRRLKLGLIGAGFVAALFALHPMRVESVAWVTERKDVLYGMFFLAAMYQYIRTKTNPTLWRYVLIYLFFGLSLLSKIQAVALPLVMVAIDFLLDEKFELKSVINKWPYFLISFLWGVLGIVVLGSEGSLDTNDVTYPFWQRIFIGSFSYLVYLVKVVIPYELSPLYPYPPSMPAYFYPTIVMVPIVGYLAWMSYTKGWKVFGFA